MRKRFLFCHAAKKGGFNVCGSAEAQAAELPGCESHRAHRGVSHGTHAPKYRNGGITRRFSLRE
jgi:hypothetical protein